MATSNPYSDTLLMDALRGSLSNAESFGRGFAVAPVGLLGDIEGLLRKGVNFSFGRGGVNVGETPVLPTTEGLLSNIPRMTPRRMETAGMEQIGSAANPRGPINLGRAVASLPSDVKRAGMEYLQASAQPRQIFVGSGSKTWNKQAADTAVQMEKAGASPRDIWEQTGTFRGAEGKLRQEISDKYSTIKGGGSFEDVIMKAYERGVERTKGTGQREYWQPYKTTVNDVFFHNDLEQAYPELMKIESQMIPQGFDARGMFVIDDNGKKIIQVREDLASGKAESTILHELQHGVQQQEGFARGGNISEFATGPMFDQRARDLTADLSQVVTGGVSAKPLEVLQGLKYTDPKDIEPIIKKYGFNNIEDARSFIYDQNERRTPLGQYQRLAGEAEARLTQARMNLTPEQRLQYFPLEQKSVENPYGLDVNPNELIVRQGLLSP